MTARPISAERRRWPLSAAVALVLLLAMAMAAGCVSQPPNNIIPENSSENATKSTSEIPASVSVSPISVTGTIPKDYNLFHVTITANPIKISEGEETELNVTVVSEQGIPVSGATVNINAGYGTFLSSHDTSVTGKTDSSGIFRTRWGAYPPWLPGGLVMAATVTKEGMYDAGWRNWVIVFIK